MEGVSTRPNGFFRLSPDAERGAVFAIGRGEAQARLDPAYNHPRYHALDARLNAAAVPTPQLGDILESIASGATPRRADAALYDESESGVNFFRILNIADGEIAETDMKRIARAVHDGQLARSQLADGDVLMTITGRLGSAAAARAEHLPANINQHIVRMKIDAERCRPDFLVEWLNCPIGTELSNRPASGGTRPALDFQAIRRIRVPLPPIGVQDELIALMDAARAERKAKLAEADALMNGVDDFVMDALGITPIPEDSRRVFALPSGNVSARLDPYFHSPEFARIEKMLSQTQCELLGGIAKFSKETWNSQEHGQAKFRYIEISAVSPDTGEANWNEVLTSDAPSRARMKVKSDDIIVSLTRPHHGSIAHLGPEFDDCIASTGFAVIRNVAEHVRRDYLWCILRAQICRRQMIQRASGGNYPAITQSELANVTVPVPDMNTQNRIIAEIIRRRRTARRLRAEAEEGWRSAKLGFENGLLGDWQDCA